MIAESPQAIPGSLDLFSLEKSDVSTLNGFHVPIFPQISLKEVTAPITFQISGSPQAYIDLDSSYLHLNINVEHDDGTKLNKGEDVSTSNYLLSSLVDVVEIYANGKLISSQSMYPYIAYLLAHLTYSKEYKAERLKSALYIKDSNADLVSDLNLGYLARKSYIAGSQNVELCGKIMGDLFLLNRWILPKIDLLIKLKRSAPSFALLAPTDTQQYRIQINEATFYCKTNIVAPKIVELHERILERGNKALYPFIGNNIKCISIAKGSLSAVADHCFSNDQLPQRIVCGFVSSDSFAGRYSKNPYNFMTTNLSRFSVTINNIPLDYMNVTPNYAASKYLLAFENLMSGLNLGQNTIDIDRSSYVDGNCIYAFILQSYQSPTNFYPQKGNLKLEFNFSEITTDNLTVVILSQTQNILTVDMHRNCEIENQGVLS